VEDCLSNEILVEYLTKHRAEVKFLILSEYNEELHLKDTYEVGKTEGREEGLREGENRVNKLNQFLIKAGRWEDLRRAAEDKEFQEQLFEEIEGLKSSTER